MTPPDTGSLATVYRDGLLNDTLPFWIPRAIDPEQGGYFTALDRDGTVISTDKSVWFQGRFAWLLATLYTTVEHRPDWIDLARHGIDFLDQHCFDTDGRMFFQVTREGRPLRKRRYLFSEAFAAMAFAAYGVASGETLWGTRALDLLRLMIRYRDTPGLIPPKVNAATRPMKGLALPMSLIATAQEVRKATGDPLCTAVITSCVEEIAQHFRKPEFRCLLETVGPGGEFYDTLDGRLVCPGHSIEAGWFILAEARHRNNDPDLVQLALSIIDWSYAIGWDNEYGGMLYFRDARGLPPTEYWHDMKFWWPHNETIIATLMAFVVTGDTKYRDWHKAVHDWTYARFPDPEHGEWFGYLHRDGRLSTPVKGTMWKGPFHIPRMQLICWKLLEELQKRERS